MDNRAVTPVVAKLLAAGIAVLYIAGTTTLLFGGVIPEYRTAAGEELSERVLAEAAGTIERSAPDTDATVDVRVRTELPATIRNEGYTLVLDNRTLILDHPDDRLDRRTNLSVSHSMATGESRWKSGGELVVRVSGDATDRRVELEGAT